MYCVKCGVELANNEKPCPLCGTPVYHPEIKTEKSNTPYPPHEETVERVSPSGMLFIITVIFILPLIITLLADLSINSNITWSGYVAGAIILTYIIAILPYWFPKPNPVVFVSADFIAIGLFLLYINYNAGGDWFLSFALPVIAGTMLITISVIALIRYVRKGYFFIIGGAFILTGGFMLLIEFLLNITFNIRDRLIWSYYPLIVLTLLGLALIIIGCSKTLRDSLYKKFFI
ncbi:DUF6320 domain-containing protein [Alloiococcus sp. CFN-8]|uniref:DUF6320 domain-containing protein n=1 Tax=Alloiococcus sp. CFN-8 TaxID=3416081 RepID=UPI003CFA0367